MPVLDSLLERVRESRKEFVVYADENADENLTDLFGAHDVHLERRDLPSGSIDPFLVVTNDGGEFAGAIAIENLEGLLESPVEPSEERESVSEGYQILFELLESTVFGTMKRSELLAVSREIEDRAARAGAGTLRASFQRHSAFAAQVEVYRWLGASTDLDVHVHGLPDGSPPALPGVQFHPDPGGVLERYWVLAFETDRYPPEANALVARQDGETYEGFWTDDVAMTREVASLLARS
jgi:hypothetical protein